MLPHHIRVALLTATTLASASLDQAGDACLDGFMLCNPAGATSDTTPRIGSPEFEGLFVDIILSSLPTSKRHFQSSPSASLCCTASLSCLVMANLEIPFCYDRFTTDYYLPDGSYGTVVGGAYNSSTGDLANLETGEYTLANGTTGNIYHNNQAAKPNTAILPLPSQFTASGVGTAIPASALGGETTLTLTSTITLSGKTIPPSTISALTIPASVRSDTIILEPTVSAEEANSLVVSTSIVESVSPTTILGTTISGSTVPGTTMEPIVATLTTTEIFPKTASPGTSVSATGAKKNGGNQGWVLPSYGALYPAFMIMIFV